MFSDIDECSDESHACDGNANCTNTNGSFKCDCKTGFSENGNTCTGIFGQCYERRNSIIANSEFAQMQK